MNGDREEFPKLELSHIVHVCISPNIYQIPITPTHKATFRQGWEAALCHTTPTPSEWGSGAKSYNASTFTSRKTKALRGELTGLSSTEHTGRPGI